MVNTIHFKGSWLHQFSEKQTKLEEFTIPGSPAVKVPMMNKTFLVNHLDNDDFQLAQLPYKDNEVSMVIILPNKKDGLAEVEKKLSPKLLQQALAQAKMKNLQVSLPKFKVTERFNLVDELKSLGMKDAFVAEVADFTGMEDKVSRGQSLFISKVIHKAFVEVNESGTEAAAVTLSIALSKGMASDFIVDHPFIFLIRENGSGSILFVGRIVDPTK